MEAPDGIPLWVQIFGAMLTAAGTAVGGLIAYKKGTSNPQSNTNPVVVGIGASLADRQASQEINDCLNRIAQAIDRGTDELRRVNRTLGDNTEVMVEEHARLRTEAAEIRRHLEGS